MDDVGLRRVFECSGAEEMIRVGCYLRDEGFVNGVPLEDRIYDPCNNAEKPVGRFGQWYIHAAPDSRLAQALEAYGKRSSHPPAGTASC